MTGQKFDQGYIRAMIKDHDQAVALFQREAQGVNPNSYQQVR